MARRLEGGSFRELRTSRDPMAVVPDVRNVVRQAGSDIPVVNVRTQTETIERQLFQERLVARLASSTGMVAPAVGGHWAARPLQPTR